MISDASGYPGHAEKVLSPVSEEELAGILAEASREGVPVTAMGAMTGLTGGASPQGGWAISMRHFRKSEICSGDARIGSGVLLKEVQSAALASGQFYPPDPTENTSSIGGNVNTNASGSRSFRYGATRESVRALRVVTLDGRIQEYSRGTPVDFAVPSIPLPRSTKHSAGYRLAPGMDFVDLFVGSEGTLGFVTEAELRLLPTPPEILGGVVFFPSEDAAFDAIERWRTVPGVRMLEYLDGASLEIMDVHQPAAVIVEQELSGEEGDLDMTGALEDDSWFGTSPADRERFRLFRHGLAEKVVDRVRKSGWVKVGSDYAVPREKTREIMAVYRRVLEQDLGIPYIIYGHAGDAHLHINCFPSNDSEHQRAKEVIHELAHPVVEMGGTVSAEHGLGKRKTDLLRIQYSSEAMEAMKAVKRRFDPNWLLGQGTLFG